MREVNFDGIIGPTHSYAGLSPGNIASLTNRATVSHPRQAALEGLSKMNFLRSLGLVQGVIPPQERPHLPTLRRLGFSGSDGQVIEAAYQADPTLLAAACSASCMWAANAATVSPSVDCADGRVHLTPANLVTQFHRSIEPPATTRILRAIFSNQRHFAVHDPLPAHARFGDEGAANHIRLCASHGQPGLEVFVFGRSAGDDAGDGPVRNPARQTREACHALARQHGLADARTIHMRQSPAAIDLGAFHNDVVSVGNENVLLYHELAFAPGPAALMRFCDAFAELTGGKTLHLLGVPSREVTLDEAVASYLFNSQLVTLPAGGMALIAPIESQEHPRVKAAIDRLLAMDSPLKTVHYVDVRQSMKNGGGPACLRLRVVLSDEQMDAVHPSVILTDSLSAALESWIKKHYRETLCPDDLREVKLVQESRDALDELCGILKLGSIYEFPAR